MMSFDKAVSFLERVFVEENYQVTSDFDSVCEYLEFTAALPYDSVI